MKGKIKKLKGKGEVDYDFSNDILFFKTKDRKYAKSIELDNIVLDIDSKGFITGVQIFGASKFLKIEKIKLRDIPDWNFHTKTEKVRENGKTVTKVEIRIEFSMRVRNKLVQKNPIIMPQPISEQLPDSELACVATAV